MLKIWWDLYIIIKKYILTSNLYLAGCWDSQERENRRMGKICGRKRRRKCKERKKWVFRPPHTSILLYIIKHAFIPLCEWVCVCVCVWERECESDRKKKVGIPLKSLFFLSPQPSCMPYLCIHSNSMPFIPPTS